MHVMLALIHNNNEERTSKIRTSLEELRKKLEELAKISYVEIAYQPPIVPYLPKWGIRKEIIYKILDYQWRGYKELPQPSRWQIMGIAYRMFKRLFKKRYKVYYEKETRTFAIETTVTDKHIRAWDLFLENDADYLICFEDDAVFQEDSINNIANIIKKASQEEGTNGLYADLAGGCSLADLEISHLEKGRDDNFITYKKPLGNTACVYLLNKKLARLFRHLLLQRPYYRLIGIDWMMNKLFIELGKKNEEIVCFHAYPPIIHHGSITGYFKAWERN